MKLSGIESMDVVLTWNTLILWYYPVNFFMGVVCLLSTPIGSCFHQKMNVTFAKVLYKLYHICLINEISVIILYMLH